MKKAVSDMIPRTELVKSTEIKAKTRNSNLELYRVIVMLLIVAHHYVVNSGLQEMIYSEPITFNSIFLLFFGAWGKPGINCFVLITGYFMCEKQISARKYAKLLFTVEFYKIIFYLIFLITGYQSFSIKTFLKALLPISSVYTNFTGCYLLFYLFIPFLNILINNMKKKQHEALLSLTLIIYTILGTVPKFTVYMNYVSWFIVLYLIGSYLKLYPQKFFDNTKVWGVATLISVVMSLISIVGMVVIGEIIGKKSYYFFLQDSNKILTLAFAVCAFMFFKNIKVPYSKVINAMGATTFGVLLIHANSDAMRRWLWVDVLNNTNMFKSKFLILHAVISVIIIFAIASAIDYLKSRYIDKIFLSLWDSKLANKFENLKVLFCNIL